MSPGNLFPMQDLGLCFRHSVVPSSWRGGRGNLQHPDLREQKGVAPPPAQPPAPGVPQGVSREDAPPPQPSPTTAESAQEATQALTKAAEILGGCARLWGGLRVGAAQRKGVGRNKAFLHGDSLFSPQLLKIGGFMLQAQKGKEGDAWLGGRKVTCGHPWLGEGERCTCPAPRDLCTSRASEGTPSCYIQGCTTHLQVALPL